MEKDELKTTKLTFFKNCKMFTTFQMIKLIQADKIKIAAYLNEINEKQSDQISIEEQFQATGAGMS